MRYKKIQTRDKTKMNYVKNSIGIKIKNSNNFTTFDWWKL